MKFGSGQQDMLLENEVVEIVPISKEQATCLTSFLLRTKVHTVPTFSLSFGVKRPALGGWGVSSQSNLK